MNENTLGEIRNRAEPNDELYTPQSLAKKFISHIDIEPSDSCFDPFYGTGAFYNNFNNNSDNDFTEINLGSDFFKYNKKHDWGISNPPFSQLTNIIKHTLNLSIKGFAYVIPSYSLTHQRLKLINSFGFYINRIIYFENPKQWRLGFQMLFVIFTKEQNDKFINLKSNDGVQRRLFNE